MEPENDKSLRQDVNVAVGTGTLSFIGASAQLTVHNQMAAVAPDHPMFLLIGRALAAAAQYEHALDLALWTLSGTDDQRASCLTAQINGAYAKIVALKALLSYAGYWKAFKIQWKSIDAKNNNISNERNRLVHDAWFFETETGEIAQFKSSAKPTFEYGIRAITETEVVDLTTRIQALSEEVLQLRSDVFALQAPKA